MASLLEDAVARRVFPGAALVVARDGRVALGRGFGRLTYAPDAAPVDLDTVYDLASLTKVIATTTLAMRLFEAGQLDLDAPASAYLPAFAAAGKAAVTVRDLLAHCSGLPAGFPGGFLAYSKARGLPSDRTAIVAEVCATGLECPPRTRAIYTDLGAIALGAIVESVAGDRLDRLAASQIFGPLGMGATRYLPPAEWLPRIAPTEMKPERGQVIHGEVHDECAWAMGGVSGHAGLFGSARDLAVFGQALLEGGTLAGRRIVGSETLAEFVRPDGRVPGSDRALGWQVASPENSAGPDLSSEAYGHTGFTGTSLWVDPPRRLVVVLLSNRVHPTRENVAIVGLRPALHSAVVAALR